MCSPTPTILIPLIAACVVSVSVTAEAQSPPTDADPAEAVSTDGAPAAAEPAEEESAKEGTTPAVSTAAASEKRPTGWLANQHEKEAKRVDVDKSRTPHLNLSGPRAGAYYLATDQATASVLQDAGMKHPFFMFLGYQFEFAWLANSAGTAGLIEVVPVVSGFSHGKFLPSLNLLVGIRSSGGVGFALGAQTGLGLTVNPGLCGTNSCPGELGVKPFAAGVAVVGFAIPAGELVFPIDLVLSYDDRSVRVGLSTGFAGFL